MRRVDLHDNYLSIDNEFDKNTKYSVKCNFVTGRKDGEHIRSKDVQRDVLERHQMGEELRRDSQFSDVNRGAKVTPNLDGLKCDVPTSTYAAAEDVKPDSMVYNSYRATIEEVWLRSSKRSKKLKSLKGSIIIMLSVLKIYTEKLKKESEIEKTISLKCDAHRGSTFKPSGMVKPEA